MRKVLLNAAVVAASMASLSSYGQDVKIYTSNPEVDEVFGTVYGISDNGKYAVGSDDAIGLGGYYLDMESGEFVYFGDIETSSSYFAYDVSDNGIIVGSCPFPDAVDEEGNPVNMSGPGYYKDGQWYPLPLKVYMSGDDIVNGCARAISPDGRIIAGYIKRARKEGFEPVLWVDGEIKDFPDVPVMGQGNIITHMSADGTVLSGFAEWESGARSAAIWKDGELLRLSTLEDPMESGAEWLDSEGYMSVSPNGQYLAGYTAESSSGVGRKGLYGDVESVAEGLNEVEEVMFSCVDNEGTFYATDGGSAYVMKSGGELERLDEKIDLGGTHVQTIMSASKTGKVLGGCSIVDAFGMTINIPLVIVQGEELSVEENIDAVCCDVAMAGSVLHVSGYFDTFEIYDMAGNMVESGTSPMTDLSSLQKGIYVVKVICGNGVKTIKISKN